MTTALTLGKYAPLHKGHELVIEEALSQNDHLIVIVYDSPQVTNIPLTVRANWIRKLYPYPNIEVIEGWNAPCDSGDTDYIKKVQEQYILRILNGRKIDAFYSSEFYGEHVSKALNAKNCVVDMNRLSVPISSTLIRQDAYRHRDYISDIVYKDLITQVVFMGSVSTGKSTIAEDMARLYKTVFMPEYGREYWDKHQINRRLTKVQLREIAEGHITRKNKLIKSANKYLFVDTNAITTRMFSMYYHGSVDDVLEQYANNDLFEYDLFFLCGDDIPYEDTPDRSGDVNRKIFQKQIREDLLDRKIPFITLNGSRVLRTGVVSSILDGVFRKYESIANCFY